MELSIRDWMLVIGVLLLIAVVLDGYRKAQRERRNQVRLSRNAKRMQKVSSEEKQNFEPSAELPNGGARVINSRDVDKFDPLNPPEIKSERIDFQGKDVKASAADIAPLSADKADEAYEVDPLFVNPFEHEARVSTAQQSMGNGELPSFSAEELQPEPVHNNPPLQAPDDIIVLNVLAVDKDGFSGEDLLHILLACDCRFGEMNIFHRYEAENAQGEIQFSIVNVVEPGIFDLEDIQSCSTPGVSFFIRLPGPKNPISAFEAMIETAQCLVRNLNGSLRDEQNSTITEQTLEHLRERIRTYQARKNFSH